MVPVSETDATSLDRVVDPPLRAGADVVYVLVDGDCGADLAETVETRLRAAGVTVRRADADHEDMYEMAALVTTVARRHSEDSVFVSAATSSRIAAIGAAMGVMDSETDVRAYLLESTGDGYEPYTIDEPGEMGFVEASIDAPTRAELASMAVVFARNQSRPAAIVKRRTLVSLLVQTHPTVEEPVPFVRRVVTGDDAPRSGALATDGFDALTRTQQKQAYELLKNRVVHELQDRGYLTVEPHGQSDALQLTSAGVQALKVYRHEVADVVAALADELSTRRWPDWFEQGFAPLDAGEQPPHGHPRS
jgi:hypothetical protein